MKQRVPYEDSIGREYGMLTVLAIVGRTDKMVPIVKCRCRCGKIVEVLLHNVRSGMTRSCGCLKKLRWQKQPTATVDSDDENTVMQISGNVRDVKIYI